MTTPPKLVDHPSAWKSSDFSSSDDYAFDLQSGHLNAIASALEAVQAQGRRLEEIGPNDFALPEMAEDLARIRAELVDGRGIVLLRGLPVEQYTVDELAMIYWGLGTHWGRGLSQSHHGDRIGFVTHNPDRGENWRGYQSQAGQKFHTDADDIVGLFCIRPAMKGGLSRLISASSIYNEIAKDRPDLLAPLAEGYYFHWFGERPPGADATSDYKIPVLSWAEDLLSVCYLRGYMTHAAKERNAEFPPKLTEALDLVEALWTREDLVLEFPPPAR